ncbi:cation transporting ATPase C-terminal domain-containing protein [Leisingera sp. MMG026]|uniref:cation transporting ATPase C-terminal domain-containing protein n=1 Tax=Leisingera sp. MMG026 TaxID=2909982 RepID=UPI0031BAB7FB
MVSSASVHSLSCQKCTQKPALTPDQFQGSGPVAQGLYTGLASLWLFLHLLDGNEDLTRTAAFTAMVVFEKASVFAFRSLHPSSWRIGFFSNPLLLAALTLTIGAQVAA